MNEAKVEDIEDLERDLNNLDQQRSEYQRLQAEANKKPAAKQSKSNDDVDKKMQVKKAKSNDDGDDDKDKKMPTVELPQEPTIQLCHHQTMPIERTTGISDEDARKWLRQHKAKVSLEDGSVRADCPIPPQIQQWLDNERRKAAALRQREAKPSQ